MKTEDFNYDLPEEFIAQSPALPRESCRLLVLNRKTGTIEHKVFSDILDYLVPGDLLVVNNTKVMTARLLGHKQGSDTAAEVLLLSRRRDLDTEGDSGEHWEALVKPGRRLKPGAIVEFEGMKAHIIDWGGAESKGQRIIRLEAEGSTPIAEVLGSVGTLPLPPYIKGYTDDTSLYQTVYAREQNSAAAPTAGLHFSEELLNKAQEKGCELASVCLEIGLDTFRKVEEEDIEDHQIHSEVYTVSQDTAAAVTQAKAQGRRVIAVGTTAVRALESAAEALQEHEQGTRSPLFFDAPLMPVNRERTRLYITPGYRFKIIDALITNFHTPQSTLLMLVSAFTGHDTMLSAYQEALEHRYRFLSFGDAMFIT